MHWDRIALEFDDLLGVLLCVRLLRLRLHRVYVIFCVLVILQIAGSSIFLADYVAPNWIDYRIFWLSTAPLGWIVLLWLVYTVLSAVLAQLPGILNFSRLVLNISFLAAAIAAAISSGRTIVALFSPTRTIGAVLSVALVVDRSVSICGLLALLAVLLFFLWFPVELPRNLIMFNLGLVLYFLTQIGVMLAPKLFPRVPLQYFSALDIGLIGFCFLYWTTTITADGQRASVRVGHRWEPGEQQRLIDQLESMNAALLRSARGANQLSAETRPKRGVTS